MNLSYDYQRYNLKLSDELEIILILQSKKKNILNMFMLRAKFQIKERML